MDTIWMKESEPVMNLDEGCLPASNYQNQLLIEGHLAAILMKSAGFADETSVVY